MSPERHEVLIIGAGPAGLSAALWLKDFGIECVLLERESQPGGQLHRIHAAIPNFLTAYGWDGERFAGVALADARAASLPILVGEPVRRITAGSLTVHRRREKLSAKSLILATGLRRRTLGVPGEARLTGRGVSHSANRDRERFADRPVAVVGGGTAAVEDALLCAENGSEVTLIHHSKRFRARSDFLARAAAHPRITTLVNTSVVSIEGEQVVDGVRVRGKGARATHELAVHAVFVRIGWEPETELLRGIARLDRQGYVRVGAGGRTNVSGIYAIGDVCSPDCPSISSAVGQGAEVAWEIARGQGRLKR